MTASLARPPDSSRFPMYAFVLSPASRHGLERVVEAPATYSRPSTTHPWCDSDALLRANGVGGSTIVRLVRLLGRRPHSGHKRGLGNAAELAAAGNFATLRVEQKQRAGVIELTIGERAVAHAQQCR